MDGSEQKPAVSRRLTKDQRLARDAADPVGAEARRIKRENLYRWRAKRHAAGLPATSYDRLMAAQGRWPTAPVADREEAAAILENRDGLAPTVDSNAPTAE